jgi:prepilin-type processing-associated H-X9-DG protein/prepilin-type N-terminal cleavage/methylation domain-containing protein
MKNLSAHKMVRPVARAFTLVELLVVIGIIAVLIGILMPVMSRARAQAQAVKCSSNLRQIGMAINMYINETKGFFPYPTTTLGEQSLWFTAIDKYMVSNPDANRNGASSATGQRTYHEAKQCVVWQSFEGPVNQTTVQAAGKESAKTYKMNSHLRRRWPKRTHAKTSMIKNTWEFVMVGDATSLDVTGDHPDLSMNIKESNDLSFEVGDPTQQAGPAIRHSGGANILFVDGHVMLMKLPTIDKPLQQFPTRTCLSWESEWVDNGGNLADYPDQNKEPAAVGLKRNPDMPLFWSDPPRLMR